MCANATAPVPNPVPKAPKDADGAAGKKRPAQGEAAPWAGPARKLAEDPFALAAARSRDTAREAFLARLEAQQRGAGGGGAGGAGGDDDNDEGEDDESAGDDVPLGRAGRGSPRAAAGGGGSRGPERRSPRGAAGGASPAARPKAAAPPPAAAAAAAAAAEVVDLVSSDEDDDEVQIVSVVAKPAAAQGAAAAAARAGATSTSAPAARPQQQQQQRQAAPAPKPPAAAAAAAKPASSAPRRDSFDPFAPRQYVPAGGFASLLRGGELRVNESAELRNIDGGWDSGLVACLDTGNEGCTLLSLGAAVRAGLADPVTGEPVGCFGRFESVEVRGVVAGASERVPLTQATYRIAGKEMRVRVAGAPHPGCCSHASFRGVSRARLLRWLVSSSPPRTPRFACVLPGDRGPHARAAGLRPSRRPEGPP